MTAPAYPTSTQPTTATARKPRVGAAITALVLGIVALAGSPLPILNNATIIAGFIALPFAILGIFGIKRGTAIAGLATAIAGIVIGLVLQAQWGAELDKIGNELNSISTGPAATAPVAPLK